MLDGIWGNVWLTDSVQQGSEAVCFPTVDSRPAIDKDSRTEQSEVTLYTVWSVGT